MPYSTTSRSCTRQPSWRSRGRTQRSRSLDSGEAGRRLVFCAADCCGRDWCGAPSYMYLPMSSLRDVPSPAEANTFARPFRATPGPHGSSRAQSQPPVSKQQHGASASQADALVRSAGPEGVQGGSDTSSQQHRRDSRPLSEIHARQGSEAYHDERGRPRHSNTQNPNSRGRSVGQSRDLR